MNLWNSVIANKSPFPVFDLTDNEIEELRRVRFLIDTAPPHYWERRHPTAPACMFDGCDPNKAYGIACRCPKCSATC